MLAKRINKFFGQIKNSFYSKDLIVELNPNPKTMDINNQPLPFGSIETDHIMEIQYSD
jgi:branched-chain amino acid aminotransferase